MINYPEACLLAGTWLLVSGNVASGYVLIGLSMMLGFSRFAMELQEKKDKAKLYSDSLESLTQTLQGAAVNFGLRRNGISRNKDVH